MRKSQGRDLRRIAELAKRLSMFAWEQLKKQEGSWVGPVRGGAIIFLDAHAFLVLWDPVEIEPADEIVRPSFPNLAMLGQAHPPMLEMSQASAKYPYRVAYSCSAGAMAGRTGELVVKSAHEIEDEVIAMS